MTKTPEDAFTRRRRMESQIISRVIADALASDATIQLSVDDFQEPTRDPAVLLDAVFAVDEAHLYFHRAGKAVAYGWVFFVLGNSGWDVICDYTTNMEPIIKPIDALANQLEAEAEG